METYNDYLRLCCVPHKRRYVWIADPPLTLVDSGRNCILFLIYGNKVTILTYAVAIRGFLLLLGQVLTQTPHEIQLGGNHVRARRFQRWFCPLSRLLSTAPSKCLSLYRTASSRVADSQGVE
jgi:hypothetical protein